MSHPDTKERILDAAERLFAAQGFHTTSLRAITAEAAANVAAVNYHFGSKDGLIEAIFERRLGPLNEERARGIQAALARASAAGAAPALEEVLWGFVEPSLRFRDTATGAREFLTLVGRALFEPDEGVRAVFFRLMGPVFRLLWEALAEALPGLPPEDLSWRLQLAMGAMGRAMCMPEKLQLAPVDVAGPLEGEAAVRTLVSFLAAGLRAP